MKAKRVFFAMVGAVILLIALCGAGTYFANRLLKAEGDRVFEHKLEKAVLDKQSAALTQAKKDIAEYEGLEKIAKSIVPQEKDQARTVLEIVKLANESGISISSITFPESLLGEVKKGGKTSGNTDPNTTQLTPVTDIKGLFVMEINVQSDQEKPISYTQLLDYLKKLESNRRTAQVTSISIQPSSTNRNLISFTLVLNSYVRP